MKVKHADRNLTEGPILQTLLIFALPMILGNLLQQVYNIADTVIVGRMIGAQALAAVGSSYTLMVFLLSVMTGLCMGSSASISVSYGRGNQEEVKEKIWVSFWLILLVALVIIGLVYTFCSQIITLLQVPAELTGLMGDYLRIIFAGLFFSFLYNFVSFLMRALGNSVIPLYFLGFSSVLNIFLDIWFVRSLHWGVKGAATATVISQAVAGLGIAFYVVRSFAEILPQKEQRKMRREVIKELANYSLFTSMQQSVMNFGILMIQGLVNTFGTAVMAAFAAAVKVDTIAYMPAQEFGNAYSFFLSQNYGARKKERIRIGTIRAFLTSGIFCVLISLLIWLMSDNLIRIFIDASETEIIREGVRYLHIEGAFYIGIGFLFLFYAMYRGVGIPQFSLVLTIVSLGTRVLLSYLLAPNPRFGVQAIWWSIVIGWFLADLTGLIYYNLKLRRGLLGYEEEQKNFTVNPELQGIFRTMIEAIGTVYEACEKKGIELTMESQHDQLLPHDRYWTSRALIYILENSLRYTREKGKIKICLTDQGDYISIDVIDNGCGIHDYDLPFVLRKHYRGSNVRNQEGYGMGLYLAQRIAEKQGGRIVVRSQVYEGTVCSLYLPKA